MKRKLANKAKESDIEGVAALLDEYDEKNALAILAKSDGGQILMKGLLTDIGNTVERLANSYKDAPHAELIAHCASLLYSINMYKALGRADKNKLQLEEMLEQALQ